MTKQPSSELRKKMQTYTELQAELLSRLQVAGNSTLFTSTRIANLIKDAYMWATMNNRYRAEQRAKLNKIVGGKA